MADHEGSVDAPGFKTQAAQVRPQTWLDPGTWSLNYKYVPAYIGVAAILLGLVFVGFETNSNIDISSYESCVSTFNYSFPVNAAIAQAHHAAQQSWEIAITFEATMQIFNPDKSVFGSDPFPDGRPPSLGMRMDEASLYVSNLVNTRSETLREREDTVSGPASLGVAALMLGQRWKRYLDAAFRQKEVLLAAPKLNGAISHRSERVEIVSEAVGKFAPFLAYDGVVNEDIESIKKAIQQIVLYRNILRIENGPQKGLWKHIIEETSEIDAGAWSSGNAIAAYGVARVRATTAAWPTSSSILAEEIAQLDVIMHEIVQGAIGNIDRNSGLLSNYLGDATTKGETSGTSLLAAMIYRMAVIRPDLFATEELLTWAHEARRAVVERVDEDGFLRPAVDPSMPTMHNETFVSPEGQAYLLLLGTAYRDCVCRGLCLDLYLQETESTIATHTPVFDRLFGKIAEGRSLETILEPLWGLLSFEGLFGFSVEGVMNYFRGPGT